MYFRQKLSSCPAGASACATCAISTLPYASASCTDSVFAEDSGPGLGQPGVVFLLRLDHDLAPHDVVQRPAQAGRAQRQAGHDNGGNDGIGQLQRAVLVPVARPLPAVAVQPDEQREQAVHQDEGDADDAEGGDEELIDGAALRRGQRRQPPAAACGQRGDHRGDDEKGEGDAQQGGAAPRTGGRGVGRQRRSSDYTERKIYMGKWAEITQFGASTTSLMCRSTATLQSM